MKLVNTDYNNILCRIFFILNNINDIYYYYNIETNILYGLF
jgi:hypothetical protein